MEEKMYSVEEVADHLGLHVRTVRGYIRSGRLKAVRIGKQYRITPVDLQALTGRPLPTSATPRPAPVEVSSIAQIDGITPSAADRLSTLIQAGTATGQPESLRIQTVYDRERQRMKIVILGGPAATADLLHLLEAVVTEDSGLLTSEEPDHA
jgi:excisionase family DNA binding protein